MTSTTRIGIVFIVVFVTMMVCFPTVNAASEIQNLTITDSSDDAFVTEIGFRFVDSQLIHVLDPSMDIRSYLVFRDVKINWWEPLNNATLRLRTANTQEFEADSTITIYGVKQKRFEGFNNGGEVLSAPLTTSFVNFNTSQFYGPQWWDIDVSEIVEELIRNPHWDGDGQASVDVGDNIGFVIVGAEGFQQRNFYDISAGNGLQADLNIGWNQAPVPAGDVPVDAVYLNTSQGWEIWSVASWLNFSTFSQVGASPSESGISDDSFLVTNMYGDRDSYMRRNYDDFRNDAFDQVSIKLGLNVTSIPWAVSNAFVTVWSVTETHEPAHKVDKGFTFEFRSQTDRIKPFVWSVDASALKDSIVWGPDILEADLPVTYYIDIVLDMDPGSIDVAWYSDIEMTNQVYSKTEAFSDGPAFAGGAWLTYEYVNSPTELIGDNTGWSGFHLSSFGTEEIIIYNPATNTTITITEDLDGDGDIDQDDAKIVISGRGDFVELYFQRGVAEQG